ncbi:uncharacterized protein LOC114868928 [Betta splendens]|uniref:Uncharacterized protein LOC114868928 n=1 Tax=Betta splendens TaxID=158456 RepID=A0A6P7P819_BETSP|nr:uncharacterized protein LOC114868928 [Betta splendens]
MSHALFRRKTNMDRVVVLLILLHVSQHALGVEVHEGEDCVVLSLQVNVSTSDRSTVVWDRKDLKKENVHIRQPSGDDLTEQNPIYANRTWMGPDALRTGDLSLTLRRPAVTDSGTYTCTVRRLGLQLASTDVQLQVTEPPLVWPWVLAGVLVPLLVLGAGFGVIAFLAHKAMKDRLKTQLKVAEVTEGADKVTLTCTTTADVRGDITVEWRRSVPHYKIIHTYRDGTHRPEADYTGRTAMQGNPTKGELSLTLQNPRLEDGGVYICTVYNQGEILRQKIVVLNVRETWIKTIRGLFQCCTNQNNGVVGSERPRTTGNQLEAAENQELMLEVQNGSDPREPGTDGSV